ncbi:hypothetical protein BMETH_2091_0 [methanotrophic bacterial endosymbiont of Bathymodiolus sp.]|jgi:hypothetical protein|nr:hypothetical protein BMETH_2091_0 [methanotrophic bacterial endosymbiont of Bathymodiolus sp.]
MINHLISAKVLAKRDFISMNLNLTPVTDEKIPASLTKDYLDEEAKKPLEKILIR